MDKEKAYSYKCENCEKGFISTVVDNKVCPHCDHNNINSIAAEGSVEFK